MQKETRAPAIFVENLPIIQEVPILFYIPQCEQHADLKALIERYGGVVTEMHECFTYQILPLGAAHQGGKFFAGEVFSAKWLLDSVQRGQLLASEPYLEWTNTDPKCLKLDFNQGKLRYTIREGIRIFELALANSSKAGGLTFWQAVESENHIPRRTADSLRNFWKEKRNGGLENYLNNAVSKDQDRFCHAFRTVLRPKTGPLLPTKAQKEAEARLLALTKQTPGTVLGKRTHKEATNSVFDAMEQVTESVKNQDHRLHE